MQFKIENMHCDGCARGVAAAIKAVDPQAEVVADPPNRLAQVSSTASREQVEAALREAGFPPQYLEQS